MSEKSSSITPERKAELEALGYSSLRKLSDSLLALRTRKDSKLDLDVDLSTLDGASAEEWAIYNRYQRAHSWLASMRGTAWSRVGSVSASIEHIARFVGEAIMAESFMKSQSRIPILMTSKQFLEAKQKGIEAFMLKDGNPIGASAYEIFFLAFDHFMALLESNPSAPNPLTAIREQYQAEDVTSKWILERWNNINEMGFYVLKGGTKSKPMTKSEYDAFLAREEALDVDDIIRIKLEGDTIDIEKGLMEDRASIYGITWNRIFGKAKNLKKWAAVQILSKLYPNPSELGDMFKEFRDLLVAICTQMEADFKVHIRFISPEDWDKPYITRRKLYEMGFYSIRRQAETFYQGEVGGEVAVIQDRWGLPEEGFYEQPEPRIYHDCSLEGYIKDGGAARLKSFEDAKFALFDGYYWLKGFNSAVDLTAEVHNLEGLVAYKINLAQFEEKMEVIYSDIEFLYQIIRGLPSSDERRLPKMKAFKDHFLFRRLGRIKIPQENLQRASKLVKNLTAFEPEHFTEIYALLFNSFRASVHEQKPQQKRQ